jgi:phosphatidylglycerol---prolipoprotein diacylglyceryl transferase
LISFGSHAPYWGLLRVNEGGMSSHGGIIGVMLVCYFYGRRLKISFLHMMDLTLLAGGLAFFFGRIANFINGELYGRAAPAGFKWAVKFPQEMYLWTQREISRLIEVGPAATTLGHITSDGKDIPIDTATWNGWVQNFAHDTGSRNAVSATIDQIIVAIQSGNTKVAEALAPALTARYPSQLYQAVLEGLLVFIILSLIWLKPRKPGVLTAWFGILYSVARIVGEQYRMPDAIIGFQLWGLTRGQWLSIAMLAAAIAMLVWTSMRDVARMGGLLANNKIGD